MGNRNSLDTVLVPCSVTLSRLRLEFSLAKPLLLVSACVGVTVHTHVRARARQFGVQRLLTYGGAHTANVDCCVSTQCVATASRILAPARLRTARPDSFRCAMNTDTSKHGPGENGYAIINQFSGDTCALGTGLKKKTIRGEKRGGGEGRIRKKKHLVRDFEFSRTILHDFPFFPVFFLSFAISVKKMVG